MAKYYERNQSVKIAMEASYGDGGSSATFVPIFLGSVPEFDPEKIENPTYGGSGQRARFYTGQGKYKQTGKFFLKGSGTAGVAPEIGKLLKLAGFGETINTGSVVYSPIEDVSSSCVTVNLDGVQTIVSGARGESLKIDLENGIRAEAEIVFSGLYTEPTAVTFSAPTFTDIAINPPLVYNTGLTIGGNTFAIQKATFDLKNVLEDEGSINAGNLGLAEVVNKSREWGGTMTLRRETTNDTEFFNNLTNSTELAVTSTGFGTTGNKIAFSCNHFQVESVKPTFVAGKQYEDVTFRINADTGSLSNEFSITFS